MAIKRYFANADNTITNAYQSDLSTRGTGSNMGQADILEVFSIFGQSSSSSLEQSRLLAKVSVNEISNNRDSGYLPESGSVTFKFKMFNAEHGQTTPEKFSIISHPLIRDWDEGSGMDMESYLDLDSSNWTSASFGNSWNSSGGDYASSAIIHNPTAPTSYTQFCDIGTEDLSFDITALVEEWIKDYKGTSTAATGSALFKVAPDTGASIKIYTHEGDYRTFQFSNTSGSTGKVVLVPTGPTRAATTQNFATYINSYLGSYITASVTGPAGVPLEQVTASLTQKAPGFYGNTTISSSVSAETVQINNFNGGTGARNYGLILKLSGSFEDGTTNKSYYTKRFFARSSHHFFKRPTLEAQWDSAVKDDRSDILRSSSLAPAEDNINNIYLYNRRRNKLINIPSTGSRLVTQLHVSAGAAPVSLSVGGGTTAASPTFITASKDSLGIYKASFAYSGTESNLVDVWSSDNGNGTYTQLFTGSGFKVNDDSSDCSYGIPSYITNITNLKSSYNKLETYTFRVYTRSKSWQPNIYSVASNAAPVTIIRDAFYKIVRVSDNLTIIPYTTGSTPSYSSLSYDVSGSFFDLDMSILEPNYLYEISFLYKDSVDYIEQKEKFKFRVDP